MTKYRHVTTLNKNEDEVAVYMFWCPEPATQKLAHPLRKNVSRTQALGMVMCFLRIQTFRGLIFPQLGGVGMTFEVFYSLLMFLNVFDTLKQNPWYVFF